MNSKWCLLLFVLILVACVPVVPPTVVSATSILVPTLTATEMVVPSVTATVVSPTRTPMPTSTPDPPTVTPKVLVLATEYSADYRKFPKILEEDIVSGEWAKADAVLAGKGTPNYKKWVSTLEIAGNYMIPNPVGPVAKDPPKNGTYAWIENWRGSGIPIVIVGYRVKNSDGLIVSVPLMFEGDYWDWAQDNAKDFKDCLGYGKTPATFLPLVFYYPARQADAVGQKIPVQLYRLDGDALRKDIAAEWAKTGDLNPKASTIIWGEGCMIWK